MTAAAANPSNVFLIAEAAAWAITVAAAVAYLLVRRHRRTRRSSTMRHTWQWSEPTNHARPRLFDQDTPGGPTWT